MLADGHTVRCLARDKAKLARLGWAPQVEARPGDAIDAGAIREACRDVDVVFYLVPSVAGMPTMLQAGIFVGSGSAGLEMIHHLVDTLPTVPVLPMLDRAGNVASPSRSTTCCTTWPDASGWRPGSTARSTSVARTCSATASS
ncbi:NAD(P)H-binding protein [Pseudonocardia sp. H11422]|uniref:NAD(P)H-binding protein n=1 Tax=Pseudonocardia sp. H11422 TaxID=2835866 RepID=UPI001BDD599C|nr:NAD(P)H-binding protein [Pseudonocardia sp. H11422]